MKRKPPVIVVVTTSAGDSYTGEYVGAMDGFMYLATADEVVRVEQRLVVSYRNKEAGDE